MSKTFETIGPPPHSKAESPFVPIRSVDKGPNLRTNAVCGERIKHFRKLLGWTQEELAQYSGYSDRLIRKAEGGHTLSIETIEILAQTLSCKGFDVSLEDLTWSPQKSVKHFLDFGFSCSDDIRSIYAMATEDCELVFDGDARVPLTGIWVGIEGLFRWLTLFRQHIIDKNFLRSSNEVVNHELGFIHMTLSNAKKSSTSVPVDMVLRMRFRNSKICSVFVMTDTAKLDMFFRR